MKITLISHASVIIETPDAVIWTDPWLFGKAFNDAWSLWPQANWDDAWYDRITHVWVSHEHPDHFHVPTLKSLPEEFKKRVTLLFQKNNSDKMPNAFRKMLGFGMVQLMPNRKWFQITEQTCVYNYQVGQMDSALGVKASGETVLNLNDCEVNANDARRLRKDMGDKLDVLLNQFSYAGFYGTWDYAEELQKAAKRKMDALMAAHQDLNARVTVPFASYIYFSDTDNQHLNTFHNTPAGCVEAFSKAGLQLNLLYPGDGFVIGEEYQNTEALKKYEALSAHQDQREFETKPVMSLEEIKEAFHKRMGQIKEKYPRFLRKKMKPLRVQVPDLGKVIRIDGYNLTIDETQENDFDLQMNSQPLWYCFKFTWGIQTLGVSGKYLVRQHVGVWKWYRVITSLNNAELYLKLKYLFTGKNIKFFLSRFDGLFNQIRYKLQIRG